MPKARGRGVRRRATSTPPQRSGLRDGDVRVATLTPIPALLRELHCDPGPILAKFGLGLATFDHPERWISFATAAALLESCAAASGVPYFGLLVGARFDLSMLGVLGQLMRNSDSVRAALLQLVRHLHLNDRGAVGFLIDLDREETAIGYAVYRSDTPGISVVYDIALAHGFGIMRALCGPSWKPTRVSFAHGTPPNVTPYRRFFQAPLHFDAAHSELIFASRWLDRPLANADLSRRAVAERIALAAEQGDDGRLVERVRRAVQVLVMTGVASSRRICTLLGIHERVLRRRLRSEGTSVHQLIGDARFECARQLLGETRLPLADIASSLGYSDATAFSRAFRRWANTTPSAWRKRVAMAPARGGPLPA